MAIYEPSDQLKAAVEFLDAEKKRARDIMAAATQRLYDAIAAEVTERPEVSTADLARYLDYHPGHVRRIARDRGVPGKVDVEPPRRRRREPGHD